MREANHTRIFVKFFVDDGSPLQMLIDERWTVVETMRQLADKHHISLSEDHCVVEEFPELLIRRIYEDDENLVENIKMWVDGSGNKLTLTRRPEKYSFIDRPETYLVTEKTANHMEVPKGEHWPLDVKSRFVEDFFSCDPFVPPELEGWMYLKGDGKKVWKKAYFVLRPSGLYYSTKGKKCTKDLQCLMNFHSNQVYTGFDWKKKYKAPTTFCISLKLTQLQMKRSSYIKYICAEDEMTYKKWLVGLRIAKNGRQMYSNYVSATERRLASMNANVPRRVDVPRVENERRLDSSSVCSSSSRNDDLSMGGSSSYTGRTSSRATSHRHLDVDCSSIHSGHNGHPIPSHSDHSHTPSVLSGSFSSLRDPMPISSMDVTPRVALREYEEDLTGTIKRAPVQVTDVLRRSCCVEEEDSDEESLPAPPPSSSLSNTHSIPPPLSQSPLPPPKPPLILGTPGGNGNGPPPPPVRVTPIRDEYATIQKRAPPPPPKRADGTRLTSMTSPGASPTVPNMSELEAALRRRQQKMGQAN
uniref:Mig-10 n=1 Tax=Pristionchus pacificus TaxID=54126 RepID=A0A2A6BJB4_PRIPA|eukprot:PDM65943.1 mig-10 [Pristionchus pacificus]